MYMPLVHRIEYCAGYSIAGYLPKGLEKTFKKAGLKHSIDGGHVFRQNHDLEIKIERIGSFLDKIFYGIKNPKSSITIFATDPSLAQPYEEIIREFLETNNIAYKYDNL